MTPIPFQYPDLLLVQLAAAIPLGWMLRRYVSERLRPLIAIVTLAFSVLCGSLSSGWMSFSTGENLWPSVLQQALVVIPFTHGVILLAPRPKESEAAAKSARRETGLIWAAMCALALLPSGLYRIHRAQGGLERLQQYHSQMRVSEFVSLGRDVLTIAPSMTYQDRPLRTVVNEWNDQRVLIDEAVTQLPAGMQKVQFLAMLGRRDEALQLLDAADDSPEKSLLAGTILEHEGDWQRSRTQYEHAEAILGQMQNAPPQMLASAYRGIAFCRRKQGDYPGAEQSYLKLLDVEPTAATHILIAQFYEDAQAGDRAAFHVEQSVRLGGESFAVQGEEILSQLRMHHFSCLQIGRE